MVRYRHTGCCIVWHQPSPRRSPILISSDHVISLATSMHAQYSLVRATERFRRRRLVIETLDGIGDEHRGDFRELVFEDVRFHVAEEGVRQDRDYYRYD